MKTKLRDWNEIWRKLNGQCYIILHYINKKHYYVLNNNCHFHCMEWNCKNKILYYQKKNNNNNNEIL